MRKTRTCRKTLAALLAVVMLMSAMAFIVPVNAATAPVKYEAYKVDSAVMQLDGVVSGNEPWNAVNWTEEFTGLTTDKQGNEFENPGKAKMLWSVTNDGTTNTAASLYLYVTFTDTNGQYDKCTVGNNGWASDGFIFGIDEAGNSTGAVGTDATQSARRMGTQYTTQSYRPNAVGTWFNYFVKREGTTVTIEAEMKFNDPTLAVAEHELGLALMMQPATEEAVTSTNGYYRAQWGGVNPTAAAETYGRVTLNDEVADYILPVYRVDQNVTVDGKVTNNTTEAWDSVDWINMSGALKTTDTNSNQSLNILSPDNPGRFKLMWGMNSDRKAAYLYVLVNYTDHDRTTTQTGYNGDIIYMAVDESGEHSGITYNGSSSFSGLTDIYRINGMQVVATGARTASTVPSGSTVNYAVSRTQIGETNTDDVTVEFKIPLKTYADTTLSSMAGKKLSFGLHINSGIGAGSVCRSSWGVTSSVGNDVSGGYTQDYGDIQFMAGSAFGYDAKKVDPDHMVLDGMDSASEPWEKVEWTTYFRNSPSLWYNPNAKLKVLWGTKGAVKTNDYEGFVYMLVQYTDLDSAYSANSNGYSKDGFVVGIDETGFSDVKPTSTHESGKSLVRRTATTSIYDKNNIVNGVVTNVANAYINAEGTPSGKTSWYSYQYTREENQDGKDLVTLEIVIKFEDDVKYAQNDRNIGLNVIVQPYTGNSTSVTQHVFAGYNPSDATGFSRVTLLAETVAVEKTVTVKNGDDTVATDTVVYGNTYTLPAAVAMADGQFVGWTVNGNLYPAGYALTVTEDVTVTATAIDLAMENGAAVRLNTHTGLRWISYVDGDAATSITKTGTLIVPVSYLNDGAVEFTHAGLEAAGRNANVENGYLDVDSNGYAPADKKHENAGNRAQFNGSIVDIKEDNYDRQFVAVGYVEITYADGTTAYFYADYTQYDVARDVKTVAQRALDDQTANYTSTELAVLNGFVGN